VEPARVGIILDSSVIITAERKGHSVRQILEQVYASQGDIEIGLSVVTVAERVHGAYRARTPELQQGRLAFIERLCRDVPVHPAMRTKSTRPSAPSGSRLLDSPAVSPPQLNFTKGMKSVTYLLDDYKVLPPE
jgi:hypothetical protein